MNNLMRIENIFLLVIFALPLYLVRFSIFGLPTNILELLAILAILFLFIEKKAGLSKNLRPVPTLISIGGILLILGLLLSIFFNNDYRAGLGIFKGWFLLPMLFAYSLYLIADSRDYVEKIFLSFYLSAAGVGIISLVYKIAGLVTYDNRLEAFYLSPNYLAMYLAPAVFFGFYFILKTLQEKKFSQKSLVYIASLMTIIIPLYYTYSYGAWLAVLSAFLIMLIIRAPKKIGLFIFLFIAAAGVVFASQINTQKFLSLSGFSKRSSYASRMIIWDASLLIIGQHPISGIGPGNFQTAYLTLQKYFPPYLEWAVPEPHNIFLAFWIQTGILGLAGFLCLLFFVFHTLFDILKNNKKDAALAAPLLGFFLYTVFHGLIDTPYWKNDLAFLFWICIALTIAIKKISSSETNQP